jgi:hypothetical protein
MPEKELTLEQMADKAHTLRAKYRAANTKAEELKREYDMYATQILDKIKAENLHASLIRGKKAAISLKVSVVPTVKDWTKAHRFIKMNNALHLLERRISSAAFKEELEIRKGRPIPGIEKFEKETLSLTSL